MSTGTYSDRPPQDHTFMPPIPGSSRSPCPALNALSNHGYIPRNGTNIPFLTLLIALRHVYNLSLPLALVLTIVGYVTCGTISFLPPREAQETKHSTGFLKSLARFIPFPRWRLQLTSLCHPGALKIAHFASLVHTDSPGPAADPTLVTQLILMAHNDPSCLYDTASAKSIATHAVKRQDGLTLSDLGRLHAAREAQLSPARRLSRLHEQVALGECGLAWCVMRSHSEGDRDKGVITTKVLEQWFGEERLPDGWWDAGGGRPVTEVGLTEAARRATEAGMYKIRI